MRWMPLASALLVTTLIFGCGRPDAIVTVPRQAPVLANTVATPSAFPFEGGNTTISVKANSMRGIRQVTAQMLQLNADSPTPRSVTLTSSADNVFQSTVAGPPNTAATGVTAVHQVTIVAEDIDGMRSAPTTVIITVAAPDRPEPPAF